MSTPCSRVIECGNEAAIVVPAPDGSEYPVCRGCYDSPCGRCPDPIEDDSNVAKDLCQGCRTEIRRWSTEADTEHDRDFDQTTLLPDE